MDLVDPNKDEAGVEARSIKKKKAKKDKKDPENKQKVSKKSKRSEASDSTQDSNETLESDEVAVSKKSVEEELSGFKGTNLLSLKGYGRGGNSYSNVLQILLAVAYKIVCFANKLQIYFHIDSLCSTHFSNSEAHETNICKKKMQPTSFDCQKNILEN